MYPPQVAYQYMGMPYQYDQMGYSFSPPQGYYDPYWQYQMMPMTLSPENVNGFAGYSQHPQAPQESIPDSAVTEVNSESQEVKVSILLEYISGSFYC